MRLLLLSGLLLCATLAEAQEAGGAPLSPAAAQRVSLAAFLVPVVAGIVLIAPEDATDGAVTAGRVLFFSGTLLGPAAGYWLGGAAGRGWLGVGIRAAITGATFAIVDDDYASLSAAGIGGLILLGHAVYDVARVKSITAGRQAQLRLGLSPAWVTGSGIGLRVEW
ncbi:MAG TPA: hypothetical protein VMK53_05255 [Gemmatimonadales bacterium]|nr:hypothetical protein [Gemmatimonadales bacterium]